MIPAARIRNIPADVIDRRPSENLLCSIYELGEIRASIFDKRVPGEIRFVGKPGGIPGDPDPAVSRRVKLWPEAQSLPGILKLG
jgi:hypothetical protein